jgi:hypothetical protein
VRRTGPNEPKRLTGLTRHEQADQPLRTAGARCCAPGAAWQPSCPGLAGDGRLASRGQLAGHGTAGRPAASGRAAHGGCAAYSGAGRHGWRMVGRGLITGGFLLCGWLVTGAGHAYAAQITAPPAPHLILAGQSPAAARPASAPLALPSFPGSAGAGAGSHDPAAARVSPAGLPSASAPTVDAPAGTAPVTMTAPGSAPTPAPGPAGTAPAAAAAPAGSKPAPVAVPAGPGGSLTSGGASLLSGPGALGAPGQVTSVGPLRPTSPVQVPQPVPQTGRIQTLPMITAVPPGGRQARTPGHASGGAHRRAAHAARPAAVSRGLAVFPAAAAPLTTTRRHGGRDRARDALRHRARPHRSLPGSRLISGAAAQTDPTSTSAGGAGAPQLAAHAPPGTATPARAVGLIRIRTSRRPALRPRAEDPAVSPD